MKNNSFEDRYAPMNPNDIMVAPCEGHAIYRFNSSINQFQFVCFIKYECNSQFRNTIQGVVSLQGDREAKFIHRFKGEEFKYTIDI